MATYAIIGATGSVGGSILKVLLKSPDNNIRTFVRSKKKLLSQKPELESAPNVTIYEGQLENTDVLADFVKGANAVFLAAGAVENMPGCNVAQQQAKGIVAAFELVRKEDPLARLPQVIVLSSASLEHKFMKDFPAIGYSILKKFNSNIYNDLRLAEDFLRDHDWIRQVYIKPGGLVEDEPKGHVLSTERQQTFLSFMDLAAGMVEIADSDDDKWDSKNVSVLPASGTRVEWKVPYLMMKGLIFHYLPWTYPYLSPWL